MIIPEKVSLKFRRGQTQPADKKPKSAIGKFFHLLGPGLITGAADDDPSGIATYSITGAQTGTSLLWLSWATWPLMAAMQMMCARIGMVMGRGLAQNLCHKFPKPMVVLACLALLAANIINIAADLDGMGDAMEMLTNIPAYVFTVIFGLGICAAMVWYKYSQIANILKWLALSLLAYVVTAFLAHPDWGTVWHQTFHISLGGPKTMATIVGVLGTTISPYLFFWQAAQEVEEEKKAGSRARAEARGVSKRKLTDRKIDVGVGTALSNIVMFFIILTTGLTLHAHGITNVSSSKDAAEALRPFAGNLAVLVYTIGIVASGLLAIPTLAGSAAYAFAETFDWKMGLSKKLKGAHPFYAVLIGATLCGGALDFLHINAMDALLWSAIVNGLLAPFLMVGIILLARDAKLMNGEPSSMLSQVTASVATLLMFGAAIGMFVL